MNIIIGGQDILLRKTFFFKMMNVETVVDLTVTYDEEKHEG